MELPKVGSVCAVFQEKIVFSGGTDGFDAYNQWTGLRSEHDRVETWPQSGPRGGQGVCRGRQREKIYDARPNNFLTALTAFSVWFSHSNQRLSNCDWKQNSVRGVRLDNLKVFSYTWSLNQTFWAFFLSFNKQQNACFWKLLAYVDKSQWSSTT